MDRRTARELVARLNGDAQRIAAAFGLRYRAIEAERANVKRRYGVCYSDGTIRIRLRHATSGRPLKYSSLVSTLCHELAHLRHFHHGPSFRRYYAALLEWARREGIYRPAPRPAPGLPAVPATAVMAREAPPHSPPRETPRRPAARRRARPAESPGQLSLFGEP
jgi:hypothetical protein